MAAETISKNQKNLIRSLSTKKGRKEHGLFIVEGAKSVTELLNSRFIIDRIFITPEWEGEIYVHCPVMQISRKDMEMISALSTPSEILAVVKIPAEDNSPEAVTTLVLDRVNDPGNLGTIIRIADWFGIRQVICSSGTVDLFNPKTIQSSMGSFTRISVLYQDISEVLDFFRKEKIPLYAATLNGESPADANIQEPAALILGSESHGIDESLLTEDVKQITIPGAGTAESLNVGMAAGILCYELFRKSK